MKCASTVVTGVSGSAPRSYSATETVRSGAATGTFDASRNENIMRFCPQANVPPGSMICGNTLGAWLPCHAVTTSLAGSGVVTHASVLPEAAADGELVDPPPGPPQPTATRPTASTTSRGRRRRGVMRRTIAEVAAGRPRARMARRCRPSPGDPLTRFQKLAGLTLLTAILLVTVGVVVRATESGLGCPDWPLCHGQLIPPLDDPKAWIEWIHRGIAVVIGFEILGLAALAIRDHRDRRSLVVGSLASVGLVGFQAWLGRETVRLGNSGKSVTAHLAAAMLLVGLLVFLTVRAGYPARFPARGASQRFTLLATFAAGATFALLLFGSNVTATDTALVFPDWPLMGGSILPQLSEVASAHILHRWVAAVVAVIVAIVAIVAWRTQRDHPAIVRLATWAAALFAIQVVVGGLQVLTRLSGWTQTLHLALGAVIWALLAALAVTSYATARMTAVETPADPSGTTDPGLPASESGAALPWRFRPRLHRPDQAADHRAPAGHHGPGHGPGDPLAARRGLGGVGLARRLDAHRRHARGRQRQRHQLLPRPRHRRAHGADPSPAAAGPPGRARTGGRLRRRPRASSRSR